MTNEQSPTQLETNEVTKHGFFNRLTTSLVDALEVWIALKVYEVFSAVVDDLEYEVTGLENIKAAKEHLRSGGRLIIAFAPHKKTLDPYIITELIKNHFNGGNTNGDNWSWGWIASEKFRKEVRVDGISNKLGIASLLLEKLVEENNFEVFYFVQNYIMNLLKEEGDKAVYDQAATVATESREQLLNFWARSGSILVLSPEATRNIVPGMMRADPAAGFVMMPRREADNIMILPLSIGGVPDVRTDKFGVVQDILALRRSISRRGVSGKAPKVEAVFGELVSYHQLKREARQCMWTLDALEQIAANNRSIAPRGEADFRFVDALMLRLGRMVEQMSCYQDDPNIAGVYSSGNVAERESFH